MSELARYAATPATSRGRRYPEPPHAYRGEYQRDRDRIVHSSAFRRLVYKTQVFINHQGDLYRTRLTHSLEVAQIARTVAGCLGLNQDLAEAIALAHDLGHTPFGHSGEDALNACMAAHGGFEHNLQSLRVVDELEEKYLAFPGLNLTFETREGILKHCSKTNARRLGELGRRFLERRQPGLEAQVTDLADEIAYNNHDVDDGLRSGLISAEELASVPLFREHHEAVVSGGAQAGRRVLIHETVRRMVNEVVTDLVETTRARLKTLEPADAEAVRQSGAPVVALSEAVAARHLELKRFLRRRLYQHERVLEKTGKAQQMLVALFERYAGDLGLMPAEHADRALRWHAEHGEAGRARAVADYLAGMTDRYALGAYRRLVDPDADL